MKFDLCNLNTNNKSCNEYVDFMRGMAMILVLLHHATVPCDEYILSLHMPLFFIIYGYVIKILKKQSILMCFWKNDLKGW